MCVLALACLGSIPQSSTRQKTQSIFRTGVAYVPIDVVVTDSDDHPVRDLDRDDFLVTDDGRPQEIADFRLVAIPLADRLIDLKATPAPSPDVASNDPPGRDGRAVVFVLDDLTLRPQDLVPITRVMTEFLRTLRPEDRVAITYVRRSDLGQDFTRDPGRLITAVTNLRAAIMWGPALGETLRVLDNVIDALAAASEARRLVVYISSGYPSSRPPPANASPASVLNAVSAAATVAARLAETYERARSSGVPIYTLDPRGLADPESVYGIGRIDSPQERASLVEQIRAEQQFMMEVAGATGGRGFVNQSNLDFAVDQIVEENGSYYQLGYYATPFHADGKFHDIKVTVRRSGLRVRARAGYRSDPPRPLATSPAMLRDSLADGVPGGDLRLRAFAAPVVPYDQGAGTLLTLDVLYPDLAPDVSGRADDELQLAWMALDPDARVRASGTRTIKVPLAQAGRGPLTLSLHDHLDLPRGLTTLRVAAVSRTLGAQGTVHLRLDVPRLGDADLDASGLVLSLEGAQATVRVARLDPAHAADVPFPATTLRTFSTAGRLHVFARVFARTQAEIATAVVLKRGNDVVRSLAAQCRPSVVTGRDAKPATDCQAVLPLDSLAAGVYVLEFSATDAGQVRVVRAVGFEIQ
ncbi:MAG: VWA domain-containing protein [Vicinamibacterales bacterium]